MLLFPSNNATFDKVVSILKKEEKRFIFPVSIILMTSESIIYFILKIITYISPSYSETYEINISLRFEEAFQRQNVTFLLCTIFKNIWNIFYNTLISFRNTKYYSYFPIVYCKKSL